MRASHLLTFTQGAVTLTDYFLCEGGVLQVSLKKPSLQQPWQSLQYNLAKRLTAPFAVKSGIKN